MPPVDYNDIPRNDARNIRRDAVNPRPDQTHRDSLIGSVVSLTEQPAFVPSSRRSPLEAVYIPTYRQGASFRNFVGMVVAIVAIIVMAIFISHMNRNTPLFSQTSKSNQTHKMSQVIKRNNAPARPATIPASKTATSAYQKPCDDVQAALPVVVPATTSLSGDKDAEEHIKPPVHTSAPTSGMPDKARTFTKEKPHGDSYRGGHKETGSTNRGADPSSRPQGNASETGELRRAFESGKWND